MVCIDLTWQAFAYHTLQSIFPCLCLIALALLAESWDGMKD